MNGCHSGSMTGPTKDVKDLVVRPRRTLGHSRRTQGTRVCLLQKDIARNSLPLRLQELPQSIHGARDGLMNHRIIGSEFDVLTYALDKRPELGKRVFPSVRKSEVESDPELFDPFGQLIFRGSGH